MVNQKEERSQHTTEPHFRYSEENPPPLSELEAHLFAVHVTEYLPKGGVIQPTLMSDSEDAQFKPTVHWALGQVVPAHGQSSRNNWENGPFAVVMPVRSLKHQMVNVMAFDTMTFGPVTLNESSVLVVPRSTDISDLPVDVKVMYYNQSEQTLREVVADVIRHEQGWVVESPARSVTQEHPATVSGTNINHPNFFKELYPEMLLPAFGSHIYSVKGDAWRFGVIDKALEEIEQASPFTTNWDTDTLYFFSQCTAMASRGLFERLRALPLDPGMSNTLKKSEDKVRSLLEWARLEIDLQQQGKSVKNLSDETQFAIKSKFLKQKKSSILKALRAKHLRQLVGDDNLEYERGHDMFNHKFFIQVVTSFPASEYQQLLSDARVLSLAQHIYSPDVLSIQYITERIAVIGIESALAEGLIDFLLTNNSKPLFSPARSSSLIYQVVYSRVETGDQNFKALAATSEFKAWLKQQKRNDKYFGGGAI